MLKLKGVLGECQETTQDAKEVVVAAEVNAPSFPDSGNDFAQLYLVDLSVHRTLPMLTLLMRCELP